MRWKYLRMVSVALVASCALVGGSFGWGGMRWNHTEGAKFQSWLNQHGTTAELFAKRHPDLAATFGPNWPVTDVDRIGGRIDFVLGKYGSPLTGWGTSFARAGYDWDVNPFLVVSLAGAESTFGRDPCALEPVNAFGWGSCKTVYGWQSYLDPIRVITRALRRSYIDKGYDTTYEIADRYCGCGPQYPERFLGVLGLFGNTTGVTFQSAREAVK